jgi:hypothetical protein
VVIVAVYRVFTVSAALGVKVATLPVQLTVPVTTVELGPVTVKVVGVSVAHFIASLKVALSTWLMGTPVAPFTGIVDITAGIGEIVVNVHTVLLASLVPARSSAPVVIVAV